MDNTCEVSRAADFRKMMHDAIDAAWAELEHFRRASYE
jgi:hypothetical protein